MFTSTAKNVIRVIRQCWASITEASKVMLFNPDHLPLGERIRATAKILATGASIVAGTMVSELVEKSGVDQFLPDVLADIVKTFCGTLVTGILSCSLLYFLDNSSIINKIVSWLNKIPTMDRIVQYYKEQAVLLEKYCAELFAIDLDTFKQEIATIHSAVACLSTNMPSNELNQSLQKIYKQLGIELPWQKLSYNSEDDFWSDRDTPWGFS